MIAKAQQGEPHRRIWSSEEFDRLKELGFIQNETVELIDDRTLVYDQSAKASLYAAGGGADYWIINLVHLQLEVYRQPIPDASQPHGHRHADVGIYFRGQTIAPLALPSIAIAVSDLVA